MTWRNTARACLRWWWQSGEASVQVRSGLIIPSFTSASDQNLPPPFCNNLGSSSPTFLHTNNLHPLVIPDLLSFSHLSSSSNVNYLFPPQKGFHPTFLRSSFWSYSAQPHSSTSPKSSKDSLDPSLSWPLVQPLLKSHLHSHHSTSAKLSLLTAVQG